MYSDVIEHIFKVSEKIKNFAKHVHLFLQQVQIVVTSTTLLNYIGRKLQENITFVKFDHHSNFIFNDFLTDIISRLESYGYQGPSRMNYLVIRLQLI